MRKLLLAVSLCVCLVPAAWAAETSADQKTLDYVEKLNTVAVTPKGKRYHEPDCKTVGRSYKTMHVTEAQRRGYKPCDVCSPPIRPWTPEDFDFEVYGDD